MVALEDLFGEVDHFLHRNVEAIADSFEENIGDVEVYYEYVPVKRSLLLQRFIFGKECKKEVP